MRNNSSKKRGNKPGGPLKKGNKPGGSFPKPSGKNRPFNKNKRKPKTNISMAKPEDGIRINKFIADAGICSRREADTYIETGCVEINGEVVEQLGTRVMPGDEVKFNGSVIKSEKKVYVLLNKPKDFITTVDDPQNRKTVMMLVKNACRERIYPVGRLDRNTLGVLLFTNDGQLATKLLHPKFKHKKIYHVFLNKSLKVEHKKQIESGFVLDDGFIKADSIEFTNPSNSNEIGIELHSGRNRIVRRIFEHFGYRVEKLDRVYFAGLTKKDLPRGRYRHLTEDEVNLLKRIQ